MISFPRLGVYVSTWKSLCRLITPGSSGGRESSCNAGDLGLIPGLGRSPGGAHGNPLQYSCLDNLHGQWSLACCSPWGLRESDTTEQLSTQRITHKEIQIPSIIPSLTYSPVFTHLPQKLYCSHTEILLFAKHAILLYASFLCTCCPSFLSSPFSQRF